MAAKKSAGGRKYGRAAGKSVERAMHREKRGTLRRGRGGRGGKVTDPKQAIAIGLNEAREKGANVPDRPSAAKKSGAKKAGAKRSGAKKAGAKKAGAKKAGAKRTSAKKSGAKRSTAKKSARKRSSAKKAA